LEGSLTPMNFTVKAFFVGATAYLISHGLLSDEFLERHRFFVTSQSVMRVLILMLLLDEMHKQEKQRE
jgi:hypothetical protein